MHHPKWYILEKPNINAQRFQPRPSLCPTPRCCEARQTQHLSFRLSCIHHVSKNAKVSRCHSCSSCSVKTRKGRDLTDCNKVASSGPPTASASWPRAPPPPPRSTPVPAPEETRQSHPATDRCTGHCIGPRASTAGLLPIRQWAPSTSDA